MMLKTTSISALTVGMPEITPVDEFNTSPAGRTPLATANVYGGVPPLGMIVCRYGTPLTAGGSVNGVAPIEGHRGCWGWLLPLIQTVYGVVPVQPLVSVTVTVIGKQPIWVGVPQNTPA